MEIFNNVREYQKYLPEYGTWEEKQELSLAKRLEYLKENPDKFDKGDIQKGKILLHAIDVMDEYSQSYAEDIEVATEIAKQEVVGLATMIGSGLGAAAVALTEKKTGNKKSMLSNMILSTLIGGAAGFAASIPVINWATKTKVGASRKGRFEAMNNELKNPAAFAVLTEEQKNLAENIAKDIQLDKKEEKRLKNTTEMGAANPFDSLKTMYKYYTGNREYNIQKLEFNERLEKSEQNFNKKLTPQQTRNAKHDQQLLEQMVRKIDIASQDYAENAELATNTAMVTSLTGGGLLGWISSKITKLANMGNSKAAMIIPWAVGISVPAVMSIYSAKIQKQASRVGRFKAKQEMLNNPNSLVYVDKENYEKINITPPKKQEKQNMFDFFKQLYKDNKEYNEYRKTELVKDLKYQKAIGEIELTDKQLSDAEALQTNVFKTFNKVDEKSQTYSESIEAVGEMVKQCFSVLGSIAVTAFSVKEIENVVKNVDKQNDKNMLASVSKMFKKMLLPLAALTLPIILIDVFTTKKQKEASRVADMLALKELEDYRHYAGYEDNTVEKEKSVKQKNETTNILKRLTK